MSDVADAGGRLLRLLAILAYLAEVAEERLDVLAARFGLGERELVAELELAACCGLPPYTPDQLLELVIEDGKVFAWGLDALRRPPRLTPEEGFALAASARALLAVGGARADGPLARALHKLEAALGSSEVHVELDEPEFLDALRQAAATGEIVEIVYAGAARGERTTREVEPFSVAAREGHFYLDAYCHLAEDWRRFLVARVQAVRPTGRAVAARALPGEFSGPRAFAGGKGVTRAVVRVPLATAVLLDRIGELVAEASDNVYATYAIDVGDIGWFARLLLRLGPEAEVLEPAGLRRAGADAAAAALRAYREAGPA